MRDKTLSSEKYKSNLYLTLRNHSERYKTVSSKKYKTNRPLAAVVRSLDLVLSPRCLSAVSLVLSPRCLSAVSLAEVVRSLDLVKQEIQAWW